MKKQNLKKIISAYRLKSIEQDAKIKELNIDLKASNQHVKMLLEKNTKLEERLLAYEKALKEYSDSLEQIKAETEIEREISSIVEGAYSVDSKGREKMKAADNKFQSSLDVTLGNDSAKRIYIVGHGSSGKTNIASKLISEWQGKISEEQKAIIRRNYNA